MTRQSISVVWWLVLGLFVSPQAQTVQWAQPAPDVSLAMTYKDATTGDLITSVVCGRGPTDTILICSGVRAGDAKTNRSTAIRDAFRRLSGHPTGWPGHVVDHVIPLCAGGADAVENMQWQTVAYAKTKDKVEVALCAQLRRWRRDAATVIP